ncbi:unnamed protein product [Gulo gulo]|uniref:Uncharacterized protein n=1 Tax=Gulo gulo TaxID=48420 RepID=A0A9X9PY96_GULGU|nr:unnamed protein product [Gulo gulo]
MLSRPSAHAAPLARNVVLLFTHLALVNSDSLCESQPNSPFLFR